MPATERPHLRRALQARHLTMIAIGGSIGTGLFVGSGSTIAQAGPGGALAAYLLIGLMVYFLMTSLGELAAYMPVPGSFATYGALYVDEGFGFALGWNYWFNGAITIAVELVAAQLVMGYWFPAVSPWMWSALFLALMIGLNIFSVRGFGEAEYWFALVKVVTVVVFIALGALMIFGVLRGDAPVGPQAAWANFTLGDAPFAGGLPALFAVAMIAGFSFQGTELVGVAAGESADPARNVPRAVRQVFWRILLFYVLAIAVIGLLIPYTDPNLLKQDVASVGVSPFALVFRNAGLAFAAAVMNAVILTAVLSAGNSLMYASARMLYNLALEGRAPRPLARLSRNGVPVPALLATAAVGALCFLSSLSQSQAVYLWLLNLSGMSGFIAWLGIAISHYRFRRGYVLQGRDLAALPYRAAFFPFGPLFAFALCLVITLGQNYAAFSGARIDWRGAVATYVGIPVFLALWLGYRWLHGARLVPYERMRFGLAAAESMQQPLPDDAPAPSPRAGAAP